MSEANLVILDKSIAKQLINLMKMLDKSQRLGAVLLLRLVAWAGPKDPKYLKRVKSQNINTTQQERVPSARPRKMNGQRQQITIINSSLWSKIVRSEHHKKTRRKYSMIFKSRQMKRRNVKSKKMKRNVIMMLLRKRILRLKIKERKRKNRI